MKSAKATLDVLACFACLPGYCLHNVLKYLSIYFFCVLLIVKIMVWQLKNSCTYITCMLNDVSSKVELVKNNNNSMNFFFFFFWNILNPLMPKMPKWSDTFSNSYRELSWISFCQIFKGCVTVLENYILKLVSAIFYQFFILSPNDSPLKTVKNVFYFI